MDAEMRNLGSRLVAGAFVIIGLYLSWKVLPNEENPLFVKGFVVLWTVLALWAFIGLGPRCPQCKRFNAMRKTGAKRREGGFLFGTRYEEWLCRYCDHRVWKKKPTPPIPS